MEYYIKNVMQALAAEGPVYAWDVVNEAIDWSQEKGFHEREETIWAQIPNYIHKAFKIAREADPEALLFYNDYRLEVSEGRVNKLVEMIEEMQANDVPIDGVGIQYHVTPRS